MSLPTIPFNTPSAGLVTSIETTLTLFSHVPCYGTNLAIAANPLVGRAVQAAGVGTPPGLDFLYSLKFVRPPTQLGITECGSNRVTSAQYISANDIAWFLPAGDYWLVATPANDLVEGTWFANSSILSNDWAASGGLCCTSANPVWNTLSGLGQARAPTPGARITFETPEPSSLLLALCAGLALSLTIARRA